MLEEGNIKEQMSVLALMQRFQPWSAASLVKPNIMMRGWGRKCDWSKAAYLLSGWQQRIREDVGVKKGTFCSV
jgi:pentatricopeptide repeat protein